MVVWKLLGRWLQDSGIGILSGVAVTYAYANVASSEAIPLNTQLLLIFFAFGIAALIIGAVIELVICPKYERATPG